MCGRVRRETGKRQTVKVALVFDEALLSSTRTIKSINMNPGIDDFARVDPRRSPGEIHRPQWRSRRVPLGSVMALSPRSGAASAIEWLGKYKPSTIGAGVVNQRSLVPLVWMPNSTPLWASGCLGNEPRASPGSSIKARVTV